MHQKWGKLLFMHWRIDENLLRPLIPDELTIDTFDGSAWIAVVPFTMWDIRAFPPYVPPVPGLSAMHELNVRTYITYNDVPGVWFFSLDCDSASAVLGARISYYLNYLHADITLEQRQNTIDYKLARLDDPPASFRASWSIGDPLPTSTPGSIEFFLTERYRLYTQHNEKLYRARIYHQPWPLRTATLHSMSSSMIESMRIPTPEGQPLLHYAEEISVDIWALERVKEELEG
jgi:uncharacterized protein YqjF (DUF2071 family)